MDNTSQSNNVSCNDVVKQASFEHLPLPQNYFSLKPFDLQSSIANSLFKAFETNDNFAKFVIDSKFGEKFEPFDVNDYSHLSSFDLVSTDIFVSNFNFDLTPTKEEEEEFLDNFKISPKGYLILEKFFKEDPENNKDDLNSPLRSKPNHSPTFQMEQNLILFCRKMIKKDRKLKFDFVLLAETIISAINAQKPCDHFYIGVFYKRFNQRKKIFEDIKYLKEEHVRDEWIRRKIKKNWRKINNKKYVPEPV